MILSKMPIWALITVAALAAAAVMNGNAVAADLPVPPAVNAPAQASPSAGPRQNGLQGADASCIEWTDGCRVCARAADNKFVCSNVGIACQAKEGRCTRR